MTHLPESPAIEGVVVEVDYTRLARAMVECTTEFDFDPGRKDSIPDELRTTLLAWVEALHAWDRGDQ